MPNQSGRNRDRTRRAMAWAISGAILAAGAGAGAQTPKGQPETPNKPTAIAPGGRGEKAPNATTDTGKPVGTDEHSMTAAGGDSPTLLQHFYLLEKLARFDRERIPERVVHARGVGLQGDFVCAKDCSELTKAAFLSTEGKTTPVFVRFSTVVLPKGSADTARDVRGFAVKFYTEEGNYDLVGNDIPVFFIRDAIKFPDLVHSLKPSPVTNVQEPNRFFDFFSAMPEATHMLTFLFSDQGTPASFRMMDGFGVNAFKWVNSKGDTHYVKYRWKSMQGVKNYTDSEAKLLGGEEPALLTKEIYDAIRAGKFPSWELQVQVLTPEEVAKADFDPLDATKDWPDSLAEHRTIGKMTLNHFPDNFFEMTEQVAFNTGAYVPGIEPSEDRLLQGRNFSYSDTQRHRLGVNYQQLPVNQPRRPVVNNNQDGFGDHMLKKGDVNYGPSTRNPDRVATDERFKDEGTSTYHKVWKSGDKDPQDFKQAGERYRSLGKMDQDHLVMNLVNDLKKVHDKAVIAKMVSHFYQADKDFGGRVAEPLGVDIEKVKELASRKDGARH